MMVINIGYGIPNIEYLTGVGGHFIRVLLNAPLALFINFIRNYHKRKILFAITL